MNARVRVIVNPSAGRGRGARLLPRIHEAFASVGVTGVLSTSSPGDEKALARRAIEEGCATLVAVGGDGTWSNVAGAILESGADCRLAMLAAGTGNDFAKSVGVPAHDPSLTARLAVDGPDVRVDVGRIEGRYFLNVAGFGIDIAVLEDVERIAWPKGDALYLVSALRQLFRYRALEIAVSTPSASRDGTKHLMLIVANARRFGGKFHIAPQASLCDGRLDAVSILDAPPLARMRLFGAVTCGTHLGRPGVITERSERFTLRFEQPPAYETDGEYNRASGRELELTCVPRALRVVAASVAGTPS
jgi:diacylglycerol kinase (ATP)